MQNRLMLVLSLVLLCGPLFLLADQETSMKPMINGLKEAVASAEDDLDMEVVHFQSDIIGEDGVSYTRTLYKGWTYTIYAFADWRVDDLDITVYKDVDDEWVEIAGDDEISETASVEIEVTKTQEYLIEIEVYEFVEDYSVAHYALMIAHEHP